MFYQKEYPKILLVLALGLLLFSPGCSKYESQREDKIIAYVNSEPIFSSELTRSLLLKGRQDPLQKITPQLEKEQLDMIIDKKLILQQAVKNKLAQREKFVNTIKTFWEQTLIRDFMEFKNRELRDRLSISKNDIDKFVKRIGKRVTFRIVRSRDVGEIETLFKKMKEVPAFEMTQGSITGPLAYGDINARVLMDAFDLPVGSFIKKEAGGYYYLIKIIKTEDTLVKPDRFLKEAIKDRVKAMKKRLLFEDWFNVERKKAKIKIILEDK